jgi:hypothetical protein
MPTIHIGPPPLPAAKASPAILVPEMTVTSLKPAEPAPAAVPVPEMAVASLKPAEPAPAAVLAPDATPAIAAAVTTGSISAPDPPEAKRNGGPPSIADTFERLLSAEDVEASFARLEMTESSPAASSARTSDLDEVRELFAQLAANHVRPVRDFVIELRWSDATADWLPICLPALRSLSRAAEKLELDEVCAALERFGAALSEAQSAGAPTIGGDRRQAILGGYEEVVRVMPQAIALDMDRSQREAVILQSLLLQVPEVKKVTLDKMVAAGLSTLEAMFLATPSDIASTTGIPLALAERIVARFRAYRDQVRSIVPDATRARERARIAELTALLRKQHEDYERAAQAWSREAEDAKKLLRKARAQTMLDIQVELARLGEVERLAVIEKLPFESKLAKLEAFLAEARDRYVVQP